MVIIAEPSYYAQVWESPPPPQVYDSRLYHNEK